MFFDFFLDTRAQIVGVHRIQFPAQLPIGFSKPRSTWVFIFLFHIEGRASAKLSAIGAKQRNSLDRNVIASILFEPIRDVAFRHMHSAWIKVTDVKDCQWMAVISFRHRHRLRAALQANRGPIIGLPGRAGSGFRKGNASGVLFCAEVELADGLRNFLRFVPATDDWRPQQYADAIVRETGTCLRIIDCTEETTRHVPPELGEGVFAFWDAARASILAEWDELADPANIQPQVRLPNRQVAGFIRAHPPNDTDLEKVSKALDILEAPWPRREEGLLREQFRDRTGAAAGRSLRLVEWILTTGLERYTAPPPLPPIAEQDLRLVCWMAVTAD
jgi:hypothetical protein